MTANSDECRAILFNSVTKDKYLLNHIIKTVPVRSEESCELICYEDPDCVSYNYGPILSEIPLCELSNSTHLQVTSTNFVSRNGYSYRGIKVSLKALKTIKFYFFKPQVTLLTNRPKNFSRYGKAVTLRHSCSLSETILKFESTTDFAHYVS